jgi:5,6-dimethylbenzimidazole synthase
MAYVPGPSSTDQAAASFGEIPPIFDRTFQEQLELLLKWRRDVRRFRRDPIHEDLIAHMLDLAQFSPSVGNSQPWRWVRVETPALRAQIRENFQISNAKAIADFDESRAAAYAKLKLEGLEAAPLQLAVFCDSATTQGHGLGHHSMPEMLSYSVAGMLAILWLCARSQGLGMGWVSILDPAQVTETLEVPTSWQFVAYLCIGWPVEDHLDPELERHHWQDRQDQSRQVIVK